MHLLLDFLLDLFLSKASVLDKQVMSAQFLILEVLGAKKTRKALSYSTLSSSATHLHKRISEYPPNIIGTFEYWLII